MDEKQARIEAKLLGLTDRFGSRLVVGESKLQHLSQDESFHEGPLPWAMFKPHQTSDVIEFVRLCAASGIPIVPYGAGTSLEGHTIASNGGVVLDMTEMAQILEVNQEDQDCVCQPGVTREVLNSYLRDTGLFFPIDPGANATLGGMVATSASGTNAVRYGTMKENVLALKVVMSDGRIIQTGTRARKTAAGYDLNHLFIGSEGTLGVITELTLRLYPRPECTRSLSCSFETIKDAIDAVIMVIQLGIPLSRIEFMDEVQVKACNAMMGCDDPQLPTLLMEFHGNEVETNDQSERVTEIVEAGGGKHFRWAESPEELKLLWSYRHNALPAAKLMRPGCEVIITDVCVPISRLADCVIQCKAELDKAMLTAPIVGHVGDGNFHSFMLIDPDDKSEIELAKKTAHKMTKIAIAMGGTSTGEHGIGIGKQDALVDELGENAVKAMRAIKKALDPYNIMNPGKIFPVELE